METATLRIAGMTCTLCSLEIERAISSLEGVHKIAVSYAAEKAQIEYDGDKISIPDMIKQVSRLGFAASENSEEVHSAAAQYMESLRKSLITASLLTFPMVFMMLLTGVQNLYDLFDLNTQTAFGKSFEWINNELVFLHDWRVQMALATPVQFIIGAKFYKSALKSIRLKTFNMDVLVALGTTITYFYSVYVGYASPESLAMKKIYFETGATIITLILLGKYLENRAKDKTSHAIKALVELAPKKVKLIKEGEETEAAVSALQKGDKIVIHPGEKIPVDGCIIEGSSYVDESMLTGESTPIWKAIGDKVTGGSINKNGSFIFTAEKVGNETFLAQIISLVEEAQSSKAPMQKLADKICGIFVPSVLLIAAATFLIWFFGVFGGALYIIEQPIIYAVAVLVVSCPCALGLATPAAIMVGMGAGARSGILIKNGEALERLCKADTIIFDKTGTLTEGCLKVSDIISCGTLNTKKALLLTAIAEKKSEHPLGEAFYYHASSNLEEPAPEPAFFEAVAGKGIIASYENNTIIVGNDKLMKKYEIDISSYKDQVISMQREGKTTIFSAINGKLELIIALKDNLKSNVEKVIEDLDKMGVEVWMLTGDNERTAWTAAKQLGIKKVIAEVLPHQKAEKIQEIKSQGKTVAMVGDGINDAPALAAADVGFAMGSGTDAAIQSGDVVLLRGDVAEVPAALKLSQKTIQKIKQNLFWAFIYNLIGIPIAAMGYLSPEFAALAMAFSSISVLLNSLSLKKVRL